MRLGVHVYSQTLLTITVISRLSAHVRLKRTGQTSVRLYEMGAYSGEYGILALPTHNVGCTSCVQGEYFTEASAAVPYGWYRVN